MVKAKNETSRDKPPAPRRASLGPLSAEVPRLTKAALGTRGFAEAGLISDWSSIVGAEIGRTTRPVSLKFPQPRGGDDGRRNGILTVQAGGGAALELQHLKPQVLERINAYFGYRAIADLKVQQGAVSAVRRRDAPLAPPTVADTEAVAQAVAGVEDPEMKATLTRLGIAIRRKHAGVKSR